MENEVVVSEVVTDPENTYEHCSPIPQTEIDTAHLVMQNQILVNDMEKLEMWQAKAKVVLYEAKHRMERSKGNKDYHWKNVLDLLGISE